MSYDGYSIERARRALASKLTEHGIETPGLDARLLLGEVLQLDLTGLLTAGDRKLTAAEAAAIEKVATRRIAGEPVARILGRKEFWGLSFELSAATLVPRPDTETVIEAALAALKPNQREQPLRIVDVGTGTGAILLALLSELPQAIGIGIDISIAAITTATRNAQHLSLSGRATFLESDYLAGLEGPFDLIVSNPPYIPTREIDLLTTEVRDHDPRAALDGGDDGLDAYRAIIPAAAELVTPGGVLVLEVGRGQDADVAAIMTAAGFFLDGPARTDLAGIKRTLTGRKPLF